MKLLPIFEYIVKSDLKGKNLLYHNTSFDKGIFILHANKLEGKTQQNITTKFSQNNKNMVDSMFDDSSMYKGVSLSRNYDFKFGSLQLILDGDLLKRDYGKRLVPFDYFYGFDHKILRKTDMNEYEEFLLGDLINLDKYLLGLRVINMGDYEDNVLNYDHALEQYKLFITKYNVPLYDDRFNNITNTFLKTEIPNG